MPLFRQQAIDQASQHQPNRVLIYGPPGWRAYLTIVVTAIIGVIAALTFVELPRSVGAHGWLSPSNGLVQLRPASNGYVSKVFATVGEQVEKGQVLFELTLDADPSVGHTARYFALLDAEQEALMRRDQQTTHQLELTNRRYAERDAQLREELNVATQAFALQDQRVEISRKTIESLELGFAKGVIAKLNIDQARAELLDELSQLTVAQQNIARLQAEQRNLPTLHEGELTQLRGQLAELNQARVILRQRRSQYAQSKSEHIVAPVSGLLTSLKAKLGDQVSAMTSQAAIVPQGSELLAELFLPTSALGYVRVGQAVRLRIEPFPYQKFGVITGALIRVNQVLEDITAQRTNMGDHVFKATARLDRHSFIVANRTVALQPEMRVKADVLLERRQAWEWLFEPMLEAWYR